MTLIEEAIQFANAMPDGVEPRGLILRLATELESKVYTIKDAEALCAVAVAATKAEAERKAAIVERVAIAAVSFHAMVRGESPSLLEDDINAERLEAALDDYEKFSRA